MTTLVDVTGLKVTCKSEEAVQYYNEAVQLFVGRLANYLPAVEKSLEIDPDFVMARCFQVSCTEQKIGDARVFIFLCADYRCRITAIFFSSHIVKVLC